MKELKEKLVKDYNDLTAQITELANERIKIIGKLELIEEQEKGDKDAKGGEEKV